MLYARLHARIIHLSNRLSRCHHPPDAMNAWGVRFKAGVLLEAGQGSVSLEALCEGCATLGTHVVLAKAARQNRRAEDVRLMLRLV